MRGDAPSLSTDEHGPDRCRTVEVRAAVPVLNEADLDCGARRKHERPRDKSGEYSSSSRLDFDDAEIGVRDPHRFSEGRPFFVGQRRDDWAWRVVRTRREGCESGGEREERNGVRFHMNSLSAVKIRLPRAVAIAIYKYSNVISFCQAVLYKSEVFSSALEFPRGSRGGYFIDHHFGSAIQPETVIGDPANYPNIDPARRFTP